MSLPPLNDDLDTMDARLFDYYEGTLAAEHVPAVEAYLRAQGEPLRDDASAAPLRGGRGAAMAGMAGTDDDGRFVHAVTETIHRRSAGRFFGKRTLLDKIPMFWLLMAAVVFVVVLLAILWTSTTGSLKVPRKDTAPTPTAPIAPTVSPKPGAY